MHMSRTFKWNESCPCLSGSAHEAHTPSVPPGSDGSGSLRSWNLKKEHTAGQGGGAQYRATLASSFYFASWVDSLRAASTYPRRVTLQAERQSQKRQS